MIGCYSILFLIIQVYTNKTMAKTDEFKKGSDFYDSFMMHKGKSELRNELNELRKLSKNSYKARCFIKGYDEKQSEFYENFHTAMKLNTPLPDDKVDNIIDNLTNSTN